MGLRIDFPKWTEVLTKLKHTSDSCPMCLSRKGIAIYQDNNYGGEWVYCLACKTGGSGAEWYAKIKKISYPDAFTHWGYSAEDISRNVLVGNLNRWINTRETYIRLYESSLSYVKNNPQHISVGRRNLGETSLSEEEWAKRKGRFIGYLPKSELYAYENLFPMKLNIRGAVVSPIYDFPGRLSGLLLFMELKDGIREKVVTVQTDGGVGPFDDVAPSTTFENYVFITDELKLGLRMQLQHLTIREDRLPLLVCPNFVLPNPEVFSDKKVVLVTSNIAPSTIKLAHRLDARMYKISSSNLDTRVAHQFEERLPVEVLKRIKKTALPWKYFFEKELKLATNGQATAILSGIGLRDDAIRDIKDHTDAALSEKIEAVKPRKHVIVNGSMIEEKKDGWYRGGVEQITNFLVFIDEVIVPKSGEPVYKCRVVADDQEYRFTDYQKVLDAKLLNVAEKILLEKKFLPVFDPRISKDIVRIAKTLNPPAVVTSDNVGWGLDVKTMRMTFPRFYFDLTAGKKVQEQTIVPLTVPNVWSGPTYYKKSDQIHMHDWDFLMKRNSVTDVFWSMVVWTLATLFEPMTGKNYPRSLLVADVPWWHDWMDAIGIHPVYTSNISEAYTARIKQITEETNMPVYAKISTGQTNRLYELLSSNSGNLIYCVDHWTAKVAVMSEFRSSVIVGKSQMPDISGNILIKLTDYFGMVLTNYLKSVNGDKYRDLSKKLQNPYKTSEQVFYRDVARWFFEKTGRSTHKLPVSLVTRRKSSFVAELLIDAMQNGRVVAVPEKFYNINENQVISVGSDLWFNVGVLNRVSNHKDKRVNLTFDRVRAVLEKDEIFKGMRTIKGQHGICVDMKWLSGSKFKIVTSG